MNPVLNIADLEMRTASHGERYEARMGAIGARIGAQKLGYNLTVLPPGKRAFPFHAHRANEEMFFVLDGEGEVRMGPETFPIKKGDVIACPPGGPERAHQITNTGTADLTYLAVSTRIYPEIAVYPDSGKFGILAELGSGADGRPQMFRYIGRVEASLDYWEGE